MNPATIWLVRAYFIVTFLCGVKAVWGFHWPWEKCECCGRKWKEHPKD
jgi:hypothetical protein